MSEIIHLNSIASIHRMLGISNPKHPLVMVIPNHCLDLDLIQASFTSDMYMVSMKEGVSGSMKYGRNNYDFDNGVMIFLAPNQVITPSHTAIEQGSKGWTIIFHPDLIRRTPLGEKIHRYSFFSYEVNEALHMSDNESAILRALIESITNELDNNIDKHTESLICSNIELVLDYCTRFYDRQFYTRSNLSKDTLAEFDKLLRDIFQLPAHYQCGIPTVAYLGKELGVSPNYLSDLLKKETGKTAKEHIQLFIIELAKTKLLGSTQTVSQIAFELGFDFPAHFTKLFKKSTGISPSQFRKLN